MHSLRYLLCSPFYQGAQATAYRDTFSTGIYFLGYHYTKRSLRKLDTPLIAEDSAAVELFAGGMAGTLAWGSIIPFDVVKTRVQSQASEHLKHMSIFSMMARVLREEGVASLFRGATPLLVRGFPVNAVTFYVYEESLRMANVVR